jgi:hypothetical protein
MGYAVEFTRGDFQIMHHPLGVASLQPGQINQIGDCLQRIIDFVGDGGGESPRGSKLFRDTQGAVDLLFFRNVANDLGCAHDPALLVFDGRDCQGNIDAPAVLVHAHGFKMFDLFTAPYFI